MWRMVIWYLAYLLASVASQSNYASQANNIEYQGEGLPEQTILDGKVTKLDEISPVIFLNRTRAVLNCAAGSMQIELKFKEKFYGIAYADFDRYSACQILGKGALTYKLELPLKGCGTRQDPLRVFTNNIVVRFHPGLEMDGDEVITVVCRYPPPKVEPPPPLPRVQVPLVPAAAAPPLGGAHILFVICAVLFLTLLLLGLGVSYLCLRRRAIPPPRKIMDDIGSIISKESLQEVKIPRAHPVYVSAAASQSSGSIPSDYPSETPSEAEVVHHNQAFILDESYHSEGYGEVCESIRGNCVRDGSVVEKVAAPPQFDIRLRAHPPAAAPSPPPSTTTTEDIQESRSLRTMTMISEALREESVRTISPVAPPRPEAPHPQLYSQVSRHHRRIQDWDTGRSLISDSTAPRSVPEITDRSHARMFRVKKAAPPPPEEIVALPETPIMPARKPEITSHIVDDVFLRTVTEKRTIEDIERHKRLVTEYKALPKPPPDWDVTIRTYPANEQPWENFSDVSSTSGLTLTPKMERAPLSTLPKLDSGGPDLFSPELVGHVRAGVMPPLPELPPATNPLYQEEDVPPPQPPHPVPTNWSQITRILKSEQHEEQRISFNERLRWRELIAQENTFRRDLLRASSREEYTRIATDERYSHFFSQQTWEVIIRVLSPPSDKPKSRYRKKQEWDTRSRRSSLPTLYEYDSEAGSVRAPPRPSYADMRSVSEVMVEWTRAESEAAPRDFDSESEGEPDNYPTGWSQRSIQRSLSQPSLARSGSELVESSWAAHIESPDVTPTPQRRNREMGGMSTFSSSSEMHSYHHQESRGWRQH